MALSNYVSHSIICMLVFRSFGFGLYGHLSRHQLYYGLGENPPSSEAISRRVRQLCW